MSADSQYFQFGLLIPQTTPADMHAFFYALPVSEPDPENHYLLSRENILSYLKENKIVFGILETAIEQILSQQEARHHLIAYGIYPLEGSPSYFESLVSSQENYYEALFFDETMTAQTDWNTCFNQSVVLPNTPLLKKHLPCRGAPGRNIKGEIILGRLGSDLPSPYLTNAALSSLQANVWVAKLKGVPRLELPFRLGVERLSLLERDLDSSEYFKGSVWIHGNVLDYVRIRAEGDIFVSGTVDAAVLIAGRRIWIGQGVKGKESAVIKAGSDILLGFAENTTLEAGNNLYADSLNHCYTVVFKAASIQQVVGGETLAANTLNVGIAGTLGVESVLACGQLDYVSSKKLDFEQKIEALTLQIEAIKSKLSDKAFLLNPQNNILKMHYQQRILFSAYQVKLFKDQMHGLTDIEKKIHNASIFIETALYVGTLIRIKEFEQIQEKYLKGPLAFIAGRYGVINQHEKVSQE